MGILKYFMEVTIVVCALMLADVAAKEKESTFKKGCYYAVAAMILIGYIAAVRHVGF